MTARDYNLVQGGFLFDRSRDSMLVRLPNSLRKGLKRPLLSNQESVTTMIFDRGNSTANLLSDSLAEIENIFLHVLENI